MEKRPFFYKGSGLFLKSQKFFVKNRKKGIKTVYKIDKY